MYNKKEFGIPVWGDEEMANFARVLLNLSPDCNFEPWACTEDPRGFVDVLIPSDEIIEVEKNSISLAIKTVAAFFSHLSFEIPGLYGVVVIPEKESNAVVLTDIESGKMAFEGVCGKTEAFIPWIVGKVSMLREAMS